ncbi:MAG TPA: hypothetical protein VF628_02370 [Allosphingosinicella sp.]|jgi:hypothetical protein
MTTVASGRRTTSLCNGVTRTFAAGFQFIASADVRVYLHEGEFNPATATLLTEGVHYAVTGSGRAGTASIVTTAAYPAPKRVTRYRLTGRAQTADYVPNDGFPADEHERQLDRLSLVDEELADDLTMVAQRGLRVPAGEQLLDLPPKAERENSFLGFVLNGAVKLFTASALATTLAGPILALLPAHFKGDPGGTTEAVGLFDTIANLFIPAGVNRITTEGRRITGKGSATLFRWNATLPALPAVGAGEHAWWVQSKDGAYWYLDPNSLDIFQLGAWGDYQRTGAHDGIIGGDDYAAFLTYRSFCLWARQDNDAFPIFYRALPKLRMPLAHYYSSKTWEFDFGTPFIEGDGLGAQNGGNPVVITFDGGQTGLRFHNYNTASNGERPGGVSATGFRIENIKVRTTGHGGAADCDGFRVRTYGRLIDCSAENFIRDGVHVEADVTLSGALLGNANQVQISGGNFRDNGRHGVFFHLSDANAGYTLGLNCYGNGRFGIMDASGLGNAHFAAHVDFNGAGGGLCGPSYARNADGAWCSYQIGGVWRLFSVIMGQEALAKITAPAFDSPYWIYERDVGAPDVANPAWVSGARDYHAGGGLAATSLAGSVNFDACYAEGGQPACQGVQHTIFLKSFTASGVRGGVSVRPKNGAFVAESMGAFEKRTDGKVLTMLLGGSPNSGQLEIFGIEPFDAPNWRRMMDANTQDWRWQYAGADNLVPIVFSGGDTQRTGGRAGPQPARAFMPELFLNDSAISAAAALPPNDEGGNGELRWNKAPASGQWSIAQKIAGVWTTIVTAP